MFCYCGTLSGGNHGDGDDDKVGGNHGDGDDDKVGGDHGDGDDDYEVGGNHGDCDGDMVGTMVTMRMRFKDWRAVSRLVRFLDRRP